jgi:Na+-translocating ferredoxin:NAD+ oxidoreductase subunit A
MLKDLMLIMLAVILVDNYVLSKFLGICSFLGLSKNLNNSLGMSGAVIFVMTLASGITYLINTFLLDPFDLGYLRTIAFILVIAALVQFVEIMLKRFLTPLYKALGIYLPLITTNCVVLGVALLSVSKEYNFLYSVVYGFGAGVGYALAMVIFAGVMQRIVISEIPRSLEGLPSSLIAASLVSLAFFGFKGLI